MYLGDIKPGRQGRPGFVVSLNVKKMKVCHDEGLVGTGSTLVRVAGAGGEVLKGTHVGLHFCWAPDFEVESVAVEPGSMRLRGVVRGKTVEILYAGIAHTKVGMTGPVVRGLEEQAPGPQWSRADTRAACPYLVVRGLETDFLAVVLEGIELLDVQAPFRVFPLDCGASVVTWAGQAPFQSAADVLAFLQARAEANLILRTPDEQLNRAVAFCQHLLDLSFDGEMMVCDLFRWKDVWARDLATGLLPGALWTGRADMAVRSLDYDLGRYAANDPGSLKNQDDTSKGGTIDGVAWTLVSLRLRYLSDGNTDSLQEGFEVMRPWVDQWIRRFDGGVVGDLTENFDHVYHELAPDGVKTLGANALWALMVREAGWIAETLGDAVFQQHCRTLHAEMAGAIDAAFWDDALGAYVNLLWWGDKDLRTNQVYHSLLSRSGAADPEKLRRAFATLVEENHVEAGSRTVMPPLTHVDGDNDQNATIWPWWNLWEARERFEMGDIATAWKLLDGAARTVELENYPGFFKEILSPRGESIGGKAFVTGAGCFLDTVVTGLLGVSIEASGLMRVNPRVPASWTDWQAGIPWHGGRVKILCSGGQLAVVSDVKGWKVVCGPGDSEEPVRLTRRPPSQRADPGTVSSAVLRIPGLIEGECEGWPIVDEESVGDWLERGQGLIVPGSSVPLKLKDGRSFQELLECFLNRGGSLALVGLTVSPRSGGPGRGLLGEACGVLDWQECLPVCEWRPVPDVRMAVSRFLRNDPMAAAEDPFLSNLETDWQTAGQLPGADYLGEAGRWVWYAVEVVVPVEWAGRDLVLDLGCVEDFETVYWNGRLISDWRDLRGAGDPALFQQRPELWELPRLLPRRHRVEAGLVSAGGRNTFRLQVYRTYDGRGWVEPQSFRVGIETDQLAWQSVDERRPGHALSKAFRRGAAYWGVDQYFNGWDSRMGLTGFEIEGQGFDCPTGPQERTDVFICEAFTDYAVFRPWRFVPLAYTCVRAGVLHPLRTERLPCLARLGNEETGARILLAGNSVTGLPGWSGLLAAEGFGRS